MARDPRRRRAAGEGGFSLLEVMVAMVVLAVALLGLFSLHNMALGSNWYSTRMSTSAMLARQQMDFLMNIDAPADQPISNPHLSDGGAADPTTVSDPYAYLPMPNGGAAPDPINAMGTTDPSGGPLIYYRTWDIDYPFSLDHNVLQLTVRVSFQDNTFGGRTSGVTLVSYRYLDSPTGGGP